MEELWKQIVWNGIATDYVISNLGNAISLKWGKLRRLNPFKDYLGYLHIDLRIKKTYPLVHRLVAIAFIPNPNNLPEVNHLNGRKEDNRVTELEWSTHRDNMRHAVKNGLKTFKNGKDHHLSKKVGQFKNGKLIKTYDCTAQVKKDGFSQGDVSLCATGKAKSHKKFQWSYI